MEVLQLQHLVDQAGGTRRKNPDKKDLKAKGTESKPPRGDQEAQEHNTSPGWRFLL